MALREIFQKAGMPFVYKSSFDKANRSSGASYRGPGLAKGLEFDQVIIPDAQESVYPATDLARRQLYTAISRAMHQVSVVSQGAMTPLLKARA